MQDFGGCDGWNQPVLEKEGELLREGRGENENGDRRSLADFYGFCQVAGCQQGKAAARQKRSNYRRTVSVGVPL